MTLTSKTIGLAAVAFVTLTGVASANEVYLSDNVTPNEPTRIHQILSNQPRADTQVVEVLMSNPAGAFATLQLREQINAGDQSVEDLVSILSRVQHQRISTRN